MNDLDYESHEARYKDALASANYETRVAAQVNALHDHEAAVRRELLNFTSEVIATSEKLSTAKAQHYMQFGVARRLRMTFASYSGVFDAVAADRKAPLSLAEMAAVSRDLNVIYINIRGVLDNYAWALFIEKGINKPKKLKDIEVGLFNKTFRNSDSLKALKPALDAKLDWSASLKSRRDPSAHRMPLYVPPAVLNAAQAARHQAIWAERLIAIQNGEYERDNVLADEQSKLGTFTPHFMHDPTGEGFPIYRTVPDDIGVMITLGRTIHGALTP
ncbi:hypothetical protein WHZ78_09510 [Bradyrhizobium symbiodeficiens]|uniref:hypothetical protein n=1 Tax=Bradyrhizobium symbiodeficiens TaxID=1404367 RepID=UPI0030D225DC